MFNVEKLAKEIFERFTSEEHGLLSKWEYLSSKRQKLWIKDVILIADRLLIELRKDVKPIPPSNSRANTSYSLGYLDGQRHERTQLITILQKYHTDLLKEYEDLLKE